MKKRILFASITVVGLAAGVTTAFVLNKNHAKIGLADEPTYTFTLNAETLTGAAGSGSAMLTSSNGGQVRFDYTGLTIDEGELVFAENATILNPYLNSGDNNYISGIKVLSSTYTGENTGAFKVDYTWGESLQAASPYYQRRGYIFSSTVTSYGFMSERPNFLKLTATAESKVNSITISFSCNRVAEAGDNLVISTASRLEQFKVVVNRGNNFSGQTVELGADIDLSELDKNLNGVIGQTDSTPFSGTFDGKNHTIANFAYTGHDSVALFSRVTGGTIKNLKMSGVAVHYTGTQRGASVVARANNTTLNNVHVLSGSIGTSESKVAKQNGGLVAFGMGTVVIENCSNAANVFASSTNNGGIIGLTNTSTTLTITNCTNSGSITGGGDGTGGIIGGGNISTLNATITNCTNNGAITGAGNGTGGIIGATGGAGTSVTVINNCVNNAAVSGAAYVGGIGGILREGNKTTSLVSECTNKGNISGTSVGVGGITGISRIDTTDCACLYSVTVKGNVASTLNAIGSTVSGSGGAGATPGYIAGSAGNGATVTGKLINADGSDYTA